MFKRLMILIVIGVALLATSALADVPQTMTVQGRLTDDTGQPLEGTYDLQFKIFDDMASTTQVWPGIGSGEWQVRTIGPDGLWSVEIGIVYPLNDGVFADNERWLAIGVRLNSSGDPWEVLPLVQLHTSPYSYRVSTIDNASGGTILGTVSIGTPTSNGYLDIYMNGVSGPVVSAYAMSPDGGGLKIREEDGSFASLLESDIDGSGGWFSVYGNALANRFRVDGNYNGSGSPRVEILGAGSSTYFRTELSGDLAVALPTDAVSSGEILDEPGVASYAGNSYFILAGGPDFEVYHSLSITTPGPGYVMATASFRIEADHTTGTNSYVILGLADNTTSLSSSADIDYQVPSAAPSGFYRDPCTLSAMFEATAADTYTYYVLARELYGDLTLADLQFNLVYFPTAYGSVVPTFATPGTPESDDAGQLGGMTRVEIDTEIAEAKAFNSARIELELATMKAKIEAMQTQIDNNGHQRR